MKSSTLGKFGASADKACQAIRTNRTGTDANAAVFRMNHLRSCSLL